MPPVGKLGSILRHWRQQRGLSQLDLACQANVSSRHVSFVETGRAVPSREMVLTLARALSVPLRERNALLQAAGYAPSYRETALSAEEMEPVRQALQLLLQSSEPFGGVVLDRQWDIVMLSVTYARLLAWLEVTPTLLPAYTVLPAPRLNAVALLAGKLGEAVINREELRADLLDRLGRELRDERDPRRQRFLEELVETHRPAAPPIDADAPPRLILPLELRLPTGQVARMFSTIATVGTPQDVTVQELRVETFHPADAETDRMLRELDSVFAASEGTGAFGQKAQ